MPVRMAALALPLLVVAFAIPVNHSRAQSFRCPDGSMSRPATAAEANADGSGGGIIAGITQHCPSTSAVTGVTAEAGQAKEYLKTLRRGAGSCGTTSDPSFDGLNNTFAVCAARFLQAAQQRYGTIEITSAFRTSGQQQCVCPVAKSGTCAPVGGSNHERAFALDVWPIPRNDQLSLQLHEFARANPQFGICFPLGTRDRPHMILAGIGGGESNNCAAQGITQACAGAPPLVVNTPPPGQQPPTNTFANQLRNALGMQPQMMPSMPAMPSQPVQTQQSPLGAFNTAQLPQPASVSGQLGTTPVTATSSVVNQLLAIANGTTTYTYSTSTAATSAPIVISGTNAGTIVSVAYSSSSQQYGSGSLQPVGQQTFSSGDQDLQAPLAASYYGDSRFQQILSTLRTALLLLQHYLTPFRSTTQEYHE